MNYKHTQYNYLMLFITLAVLALFVWMYITASAEPPSYDSGNNLAVTTVMVLILLFLTSFASLSVLVDREYLRIHFGFGLRRKKILLSDITAVRIVHNHWRRGWKGRMLSQPRLWLYAVSRPDAVEIKLRNGETFRIGTNEPEILERNILESMR